MLRKLLLTTLFAGMTIALAPVVEAQTATVMAGDPTGPNVVFSFDGRNASGKAALRITTHRVGNPGARLSIWIDHSKTRLLTRILTEKDCKFAADGAGCTITIPGDSKSFQSFLAAFKRGRSAHVEIRNAAVMQMQTDISLTGFTRSLTD